MQGIDIIGDIHGHAHELHSLLRAMDYSEQDGVYSHAERSVVFLGDFIDRGPDQLEVLRVVTAMTKSGHARAIMGNHEYNAIGWATPDDQGGYLRSHDDTYGNTNITNLCVRSVKVHNATRMRFHGSKPFPSFLISKGFVRSMRAGMRPQFKYSPIALMTTRISQMRALLPLIERAPHFMRLSRYF